MALFSDSQKGELLLRLGYGATPTAQRQVILSHLSGDFPVYIADRAPDILDRLVELDSLISEALENAYAIAGKGFQLNYLGQITLLKREASTLLQELSNLVGVAINFDKYSGASSRSSSFSYW